MKPEIRVEVITGRGYREFFSRMPGHGAWTSLGTIPLTAEEKRFFAAWNRKVQKDYARLMAMPTSWMEKDG